MVLTAAAGTLAALTVTGCGGGDGNAAPEQFTGVPLELQDPGPVHVHGLGYDRSSKTLYIATHTGMFELPPTAQKARRIGDSHQDTMGFTLVEPNLFLGSGHPDARANLPSHLGLIKSTDRGRTWQPVSLLGEADFHVLRSQGTTVYGFDSRSERLLASTDSGLTWTPRTAPEALVDLAVNPSDPNHLLASGSTVLYESRNGGRSWKVRRERRRRLSGLACARSRLPRRPGGRIPQLAGRVRAVALANCARVARSGARRNRQGDTGRRASRRQHRPLRQRRQDVGSACDPMTHRAIPTRTWRQTR